jgi:penicillin-binding protein 1A
LLGTAAFTVGLLTAVAAKIPQLDPATQQTQANTYVYASNRHTVLSILRGDQARIVVKSKAISPWMKHAIVAAEDKRFYEHRGVDVRGMARALWLDVTKHGAVQGGSTITQQLAKGLFLTPEQTMKRKLQEALMAHRLQQVLTRDEVLQLYLNRIFFGANTYGVDGASRSYFGKPATQISLAEAALLASLPKAPSRLALTRNMGAALARSHLCLATC